MILKKTFQASITVIWIWRLIFSQLCDLCDSLIEARLIYSVGCLQYLHHFFFYCRRKSPVVIVFSISSHFSWFCCYLCVRLVIWTIHIFGMSASNYNRNWDRNVKRTIWFKFFYCHHTVSSTDTFFSPETSATSFVSVVSL